VSAVRPAPRTDENEKRQPGATTSNPRLRNVPAAKTRPARKAGQLLSNRQAR